MLNEEIKILSKQGLSPEDTAPIQSQDEDKIKTRQT